MTLTISFAVSIFLLVLSYATFECIPSFKEFLKKQTINNYNICLNTTSTNGQSSEIPQKIKEELDKEQEEIDNLDSKLDNIFVNPDIKDLSTNFETLGKQKISNSKIKEK